MQRYLPVGISFILLAVGVLIDRLSLLPAYCEWCVYLLAYLPTGFPVMKEAWEMMREKDFFNEYTLMVVATVGAFLIGEYPEGVAVMLFYAVGELFQESAVNKARGNIKALLDIRPQTATVMREGVWLEAPPESVQVGERLLVKAGAKAPLDGVLLSAVGSFNTSALTGESRPKTLRCGETVLAGMLSIDMAVEVKAEKVYADSALAKILAMVEEASARKAKTELLIHRFAKVYTPAVFALALLIAFVPALVVEDYALKVWMYRALVFLVISCPCALVISVPLGYFGGIGAASQRGILFKGANFLDLMAVVETVVMDKTGTLTKGVYTVQQVVVAPAFDREKVLALVASMERLSNHPAAKAVVAAYVGAAPLRPVEQAEEMAGLGVKGTVEGKAILVGSRKLMQQYGIGYDAAIEAIAETVVVAAIDGQYAAHLIIADEIKEDAARAVSDLQRQGVRQIVMLSGDSEAITRHVATSVGIETAFGNLLPEQKVQYMERLKAGRPSVVAFVGDGINDAPALALSDIGIAMGGIGADAAIEIADVVIQTDQPSRIAVAIRIAKATKRIVMQNILLAIGIKALIMLLGAVGLASLWGAVFADVGVALLAILNSVRIFGIASRSLRESLT